MPLLVGGGRGEWALAVFGHEEEAEMFLGFWATGDGWRSSEVGAFDFTSALRGPSWPGVNVVASTRGPGPSPKTSSSASPATRVGGRDARGSLGRPSFRARVARVELLGQEAAPEAARKNAQ